MRKDLAKKGEKLHKILEKIAVIESNTARSILELGRLWKIIRDEKLWEGMEHITSFRKFCTEECRRSHATVYGFIGIYEKFGHLEITQPVESSRLVKALPFVTNEETAEQWLNDALTLPSEDFRNQIAQARGKIPTDTCDHSETETYRRCTKCGKWLPDSQ